MFCTMLHFTLICQVPGVVRIQISRIERYYDIRIPSAVYCINKFLHNPSIGHHHPE
ncbi:unnamed protein product [Tenebrio molitor]|nr:unnamed protein product [Tenebrio molitor]